MRSNEDVTNEINSLTRLKDVVPHRSFFGDDNHECIDVQIDVLKQHHTVDDVYDMYGDEDMEEFSQSLLDGALDAARWLSGESNDAVSSGWID